MSSKAEKQVKYARVQVATPSSTAAPVESISHTHLPAPGHGELGHGQKAQNSVRAGAQECLVDFRLRTRVPTHAARALLYSFFHRVSGSYSGYVQSELCVHTAGCSGDRGCAWGTGGRGVAKSNREQHRRPTSSYTPPPPPLPPSPLPSLSPTCSILHARKERRRACPTS